MLAKTILISAAAPALAVAGAIALGGPSAPPPLPHIAAPFESVDWRGLPEVRRLARSGLAYRVYDGNGTGAALLLHGSGGSGTSLHPLAEALTAQGIAAFVPDIRGHGESGPRGDVKHAEQVSEDLSELRDLIAAERGGPLTVIGFSMGGGLALKHAAQRPADRLILLSPYLAHDAPPMAAENPHAPATEWARPGVARIIGLRYLNAVGVEAFDHLTVLRLAVRPEDGDAVTGAYSWRLLKSVQPANWRRDLAQLPTPPQIFVGAEDELHLAGAYSEAAPDADIRILAGVDHIGLTLNPTAIAEIVKEAAR